MIYPPYKYHNYLYHNPPYFTNRRCHVGPVHRLAQRLDQVGAHGQLRRGDLFPSPCLDAARGATARHL